MAMFHCDCGESFDRKEQLEEHARQYHAPKFRCDCGSSFNTKEELDDHGRNYHGARAPTPPVYPQQTASLVPPFQAQRGYPPYQPLPYGAPYWIPQPFPGPLFPAPILPAWPYTWPPIASYA